MAASITALYAGILGLMAIAVGFAAGSLRGKKGISVGDGGDKDMLLAMRRHGNFAEWVPITLIVIALLEMNGGPATAIHALAGGLVVARIAHAFGLKADTMESVGRLIGAAGTALILVVASIWLIVQVL